MAPSGLADKTTAPQWWGWAAAAMLACLAASLIAAAEGFVAGWSGNLMRIGVVITAIEAIYSFRVLRLPCSRGVSMLRFRLAEAFLLGATLKLLSYWGHAWTDVRADLMAMLKQPGAIFSGDYAVLMLAAWVAWMVVSRSLADFEALRDPYLAHGEARAPRDRLTSRFYWGGGLLVLCIGMRHRATDAGGYPMSALLYFLLGLLLLSQLRFTSLTTGWRLQDIPVADGVGKAWLRCGLIFLALVVLLAALLPSRDAMGLFDTAIMGLKALIDLVRRLMEVLIVAIALPLAWLLSLFGRNEGGAPPLPSLPAAPPVPPAPPSRALLPWEIIRAVTFWLTFVGVAIYLLRSYLEDHPEVLNVFKSWALARRLVEALSAFWALLARWPRRRLRRLKLAAPPAPDAVANRRSRNARRGWGVFSRARTARGRVIQAYLGLLQQAAAAGLQRRRQQTPYEYAPQLRQARPEATDDITGLTELFMRARYSHGQIDTEQADRAAAHGERAGRALRRRTPDDSADKH